MLLFQVNDLLDQSLIRASQFQPNRQDLVLRNAIEEIIEVEKDNADNRMNEISVKIDQRVPEIICTDLDRF